MTTKKIEGMQKRISDSLKSFAEMEALSIKLADDIEKLEGEISAFKAEKQGSPLSRSRLIPEIREAIGEEEELLKRSSHRGRPWLINMLYAMRIQVDCLNNAIERYNHAKESGRK